MAFELIYRHQEFSLYANDREEKLNCVEYVSFARKYPVKWLFEKWSKAPQPPTHIYRVITINVTVRRSVCHITLQLQSIVCIRMELSHVYNRAIFVEGNSWCTFIWCERGKKTSFNKFFVESVEMCMLNAKCISVQCFRFSLLSVCVCVVVRLQSSHWNFDLSYWFEASLFEGCSGTKFNSILFTIYADGQR